MKTEIKFLFFFILLFCTINVYSNNFYSKKKLIIDTRYSDITTIFIPIQNQKITLINEELFYACVIQILGKYMNKEDAVKLAIDNLIQHGCSDITTENLEKLLINEFRNEFEKEINSKLLG